MIESREILSSYLRDKGIIVNSHESLLELLKESLRNENNGIHNPRVEECTHFTVQILSLDSIVLGNLQHFEKVEPRESYSPNGGPLITGVVVRDSHKDRIVDGYHRLKYSLNKDFHKGTFIVISNTEI